MNKNLTEVVFILDRSGSMAGLEDDTIGGFNSMLEKQKKETGEAFITTILFDHQMETLHDRKNIRLTEPITKDDYTVRGSTALLDAVGSAIDHIELIHKYARSDDVPEKTVFVITTDGMENASRRFTQEDIKKKIQTKKNAGWEFIFLGANIDAAETASRIGIEKDRAVTYKNDREGTRLNYEAMSAAVSSVRQRANMTAEWKRTIEERGKTGR